MARRSSTEKFKKVSHVEFVSAGLLSDVDVTFEKCRFKRFEYPDSNLEVTVFSIDAKVEGDDEVHELNWSVGGTDDFWPSEDGETKADEGGCLVAVGDRGSLAKNSNFQLLLASLRENGLDGKHVEEFDTDSGYLDGTKAHILRVPAPKRGGMPKGGGRRRDEGGEERAPEVTVVTGITSFPWEKGGKKGAAKSSSKGSSKSKAADEDADNDADSGGDDNDSIAASTVKKVLLQNKNEMEMEDLILEVYQALPPKMDKPDKKAVMALVNDRKWLAKVDDLEVDGDTVSL